MLELIKQAYKKAERRILFLDYDGTLVSFKNIPSEANIGKDTIQILEHLLLDLRNTLVIISGRDMGFLEEQFNGLKVNLIAEHGYKKKEITKSWAILPNINLIWKDMARKLFQDNATMIPGSFIEEKQASLAFHYRNVDKEIDSHTLSNLKERSKMLLTEYPHLEILEGNKVVEVKTAAYNKGTAAVAFLKKASYDFILAAGDDVTDETLFRELHDNAFTIKVGNGTTQAKYRIDEPSNLLTFLSDLADNM
jgi:trehalose 6-phosphate synthase/phosphatase